MPDDRADRPLTPGERAAIADLERRLLLEVPVPGHDRPGAGRRRLRATGSSRLVPSPSAVFPLVGLLVVACVLVAVDLVVHGGLLGALAVLASVVGTALAWRAVPARFGGPVQAPRRLYRAPGQRPGPR
jgi:hypothetical protein